MSERRIVVDPVTRIEGHLRVQATLGDDGRIADSMSTGTMWRGLEVILKGRDPRDAWAFVERICGVCRQVMQEFCAPDFMIYMGRSDGSYVAESLGAMLPYGFTAEKYMK